MAVTSENGTTVLTPTGWKWFVGAGFALFFIPGFGIFVAAILGLTGAGVLQRLKLTPDGLEFRNWFSNKSYNWSDIGDFRVHKVKSGLITAANMVSFTHVDKDGTMMGKAAKLLVGGTHSVPALGMEPQKLVQLMNAYKLGFAPARATAVPAVPAEAMVSPPLPQSDQPAPVVAARSRGARKPVAKPRKLAPAPKRSTPLVQDGGGLFGRRRPRSPFES